MNAQVAIAGCDDLDLAGLLCSRLCHDLLSPIGALGNGLELLAGETDAEMRQGCFELLEQSARTSSARLQFYRLAFGGSGSAAPPVPLAEARAALDGLAACARRVEVTWAVSGEALPRSAVRTMLTFALFGIEALVRGGTLEVGAEAIDGTCEIVVRAAGDRLAFDPALGQALNSELAGEAITSRTAPAAMLHRLAQGAGGELQYVLDDTALVLGAVLPAG
jgi:histidine phosphotransferase ChpT